MLLLYRCLQSRCHYLDGGCLSSPRWSSLLVAEIYYPDTVLTGADTVNPPRSPVSASQPPSVQDFQVSKFNQQVFACWWKLHITNWFWMWTRPTLALSMSQKIYQSDASLDLSLYVEIEVVLSCRGIFENLVTDSRKYLAVVHCRTCLDS